MRGVFQKAGKGAAWWIRWTCPYGHRHEERIGPKPQATSMVERRRVAVKTEGFCLTQARTAAKRSPPVLVRDAVTDYLTWAERDRPRSIGFRRSALQPFVVAYGAAAVSSLTRRDIAAYLQARQNAGAAPATVNRARAVLAHLCARLVAQGALASNPAATTERRPEANDNPRPLTYDEEARLFLVLPITYHAVVRCALHTGLRLGELRAQAWRDTDLDSAVLTVTEPKSGKSESIPLNGTACQILRGLARTGPLVFPHIPPSMSATFARYARDAKLDGVTFHCLRDTFISRLAPLVSTTTLMQLARHRDYRTTRRYVKVAENYLREAVAQLEEQSCTVKTPSSMESGLPR